MIFDVIELFDTLVNGYFGWRYLFSKSYRRKVHERWKNQPTSYKISEILEGIIAIIFTLLIFIVIMVLFVYVIKNGIFR